MCYAMYFEREKCSLGVSLKVDDERDDEDPKGFKSGLESSQFVCVKLIFVWVLLIYISWKSTLITGNSKKQS